MSQQLIAFHGDRAIKAKFMRRIRAHAAADQIVHGFYWERGKGCAVGCTIHSGDHSAYETELGIPRMLACLEDRLFEGQTNGKSKTFPVRFLSAIKVGADLSCVGWKFLHWLLTEELTGRDDPRVAKQIKACADVLVPLTKGEPVDRDAALKAQREARSAYYAANAAYYAANAAYYAADDAAAAAADYANAADYAAAAAADYAAAANAARSAAYARMADKLIELMREAPVTKRAAKSA